MSTSIETERLLLRPTDLSDVAFILELLNSPKFLEHIGDREVRTIEDAENYINTRVFPQFESLGYGSYTVIEKASGKAIGTCGLYDRPNLEVNDIGFAFLEPYEGKGMGYESARALVERVAKDFGIKKVSAITTDANLASQKLIERLGLKFKKYINLPGDPEDLRYYEN